MTPNKVREQESNDLESGANRGGGRGRANPVDAHVGSRVRLRRTLVGMSQDKLGHSVGLTFQQIQKYERGTNRIGASRLFQFSEILSVPVSWFFEEMPNATREQFAPPGFAEEEVPSLRDVRQQDPIRRRETLELVRAYYRITDPKLRRRIFDMIKAASKVQISASGNDAEDGSDDES
ncbi:MAG: helix-turn-helix transcriptional regulator [Alphaproteobacteria bacterium]|nr:MAG: helix-turn-helix transcriptional regulator [Alphaproteobacteria bacterium]